MVPPQNKIYQVFISSTYNDLKEERKGAIEAVLNSGCIPTGMEIFPASDEDPLDYIKDVINCCDYYILIISENYGTIRKETGKSYTEEEFDYAVSTEKIILVFVNRKVENITDEEASLDVEKEKIKQFVERASEGRLRKTWDTTYDLKYSIVMTLERQKKINNAVGWIRADQDHSKELMSKYISLIEENKILREENEKLKKENKKSNLIDMIMNDDLTKPEMIIIGRIIEKDCATVYMSDFFEFYEEGGHKIEKYEYGDITSSMVQLDKMGIGELQYSVGEVYCFSMNNNEFRNLRKSKEVCDKIKDYISKW